jgi:hypothetical protein
MRTDLKRTNVDLRAALILASTAFKAGLVHLSENVNVAGVLYPTWSAKDWSCAGLGAHNQFMTITYLNGAVLDAIVLSHEENAIRAITPSCEDVLVFTRVHGTWISEALEPVTIEFAWQRRGTSPAPAEAACVCPKTLAARLIQSLFVGCEPVAAESDRLYVFSPDGRRVAISCSEPQPMQPS